MKALSLTQPWASLMAIGAKHYETRSWSTSYRGPLAIAAAKSWPRECVEMTRDDEPFRSTLFPPTGGYITLGDLKRECGHIIAVVELVDCIRVDGGLPRTPFELPPPAEHERDFGNYSAGRFAWITRNVQRLPTPIPAKGALGVWEPLEADAKEITRQLADVDRLYRDINEAIDRSSIGQGLARIREEGIDAELAELDREMGTRRKR